MKELVGLGVCEGILGGPSQGRRVLRAECRELVRSRSSRRGSRGLSDGSWWALGQAAGDLDA